MQDVSEIPKNMCCFGCLCSSDENTLHQYHLANGPLRGIFQVNCISLCFLCKRMAQRAELFIQNVQSNQILLENFQSVMDSTLQTVRSQIQPLIHLTHISLDMIDLSDTDYCGDESCVVIYNGVSNREVKIKVEMKEEDGEILDHLEGEFLNGDDEFQDQYLKDEDTFPLKELLKEEVEMEEIDLMSLRKTLKRSKVKKKGKSKSKVTIGLNELSKIETIYLTMRQCFEERERQVQDKKYLNSMYKCENCIKGFDFKPSFERHMEKHSESMGEYECDICKQRTNSEDKLASHKKYHFVRYKCRECGLTRNGRLTIMDHYTALHCHGYYQYNCPHCPKSFKRQVSMRKHICYKHKNKGRATCAYCHKTYANKEVLKAHMMRRHTKDVSAGDKCKRYICQECGKAFKAPSQLKSHSIKHSHTRDYYCVECDKSFKSDSTLKQHLKTASPHVNYIELPLPCLHCDKRFAIRRDLERHTNRVHLNIRPFQCDRCDKAYVNGWSLTEHKRLVHEGYKRPLKYPCPMCDKVFDRNQILKGHIRTHTGERPYQCSKCPAQFSQASILGTHVKLIHLKLTRDGRPKAVTMK